MANGINKDPDTKGLDMEIDFGKIEEADKRFNSTVSQGIKSIFGRKKSIAGMAKENIFEFPSFISQSVPLDYATAINSLTEQINASYLQMAISMNPIVDGEMVKKGKQFSKFKTDTNRYLEYTDTTYQHDACHASYEEDGIITEFDMVSIEDEDAGIILEACDYEQLSEFDHFFVEAKRSEDDHTSVKIDPDGKMSTSRSSEVKQDIDEATLDKLNKEINNLEESNSKLKKEKDKIEAELKDPKYSDKNRNIADKTIEKSYKKLNKESEKLDLEIDKSKEDIKIKKEQLKDYQNRNNDHDDEMKMKKYSYLTDTKLKAPQMMDETKIQKLNTMKPLMMTVNVRVDNSKSGLSDVPIEYVIGVKTFSRLLDPEILPEMVKYPLKEMNKMSHLVKWRAGELKFFKDILLKIKQKKQDAVDAKDPKRKWYRRLYELAHSKKNLSGDDGIPNVTMVISKSDVNLVKSETGIDLLDSGTAFKLCKEMFLMSMIVVDIDAESIKILTPDLHSEYEIHSLASINKQLAALDTAGTKTRDVFKLLK